MAFEYAEQAQPRGLPDAFLVGREFIAEQPVCLILGDNIFYGTSLGEILQVSAQLQDGAVVFAYPVRNPQQYGVVEFDRQCKVISL